MRNKHYIVLLLLFVMAIPITACNSNQDEESGDRKSPEQHVEKKAEANESDETKDSEREEKQSEAPDTSDIPEAPPLATTFEEVADYPIIGKFSGEMHQKELKDNKDITEVLDAIPPLTIDSEKETIEKAKRYIYSLFKEDLNKPNVPLDQWKSMQFGDPESSSEKVHLKESYNVAILLDSSGSMGYMEGNETRMALAKEAISQFAENLPEQANVSLRVFGHIGTGDDSDKEKSCSKVEEVYQLDHYDADKFSKSLDRFEPAGWTPMTKAIKQVEKDFALLDGKNNTTIIYVVSDGVETCGGDPVAAIQSLDESGIDPVINIIGYQVDNEGLKQLKEMAKASEGRYINAKSQADLTTEFEQTVDMSQLWREWQSDSKDIIRDLHSTIKHQLYDWNNNEKKKQYRQQENLKYALKYLFDTEIIDHDLRSAFSDEYRGNYLDISDERGEIYSELYDINYETYNDKFNEVEKRFEDAQE
ncbi:VWA domain-containing protein [Lentibacillus cibarius]|uniref:VWA domain-containing protein n=1 Tax=Lentibacillus cibarius TaxID=2583219 RepID=A0A549YF43_9BACI|nr:VWA domain-containing protein [Lentibacillus cibarius]TMN21565.1 VWA domain-containing protein [Lentibacillus cibarius]TRM10467.1 VWA domain-containing protein [Lentibacillus cibarius]